MQPSVLKNVRPDWPSRILGSPPVAGFARTLGSRRLAVLAYHDVPHGPTFAAHLDYITEHYRPVTGADVSAALDGRSLPRNAVWITFDDAKPGVFAEAMPLLVERGIPASVFVCPGVVDTSEPYWWELLDAALAYGHQIAFAGRQWTDSSVIAALKEVADEVRRACVDRVGEELAVIGRSSVASQATSADLQTWVAAGLEVGNHTWDHPCLDRCDPDEQRQQIVAAHEWITDLLGAPTTLFAYPNGNSAPTSRAVLAELGYRIRTLFDHRRARLHEPEMSRLRIDAHVPLPRLAAIVSGTHPAAYAAAGLLRGRRRISVAQ